MDVNKEIIIKDLPNCRCGLKNEFCLTQSLFSGMRLSIDQFECFGCGRQALLVICKDGFVVFLVSVDNMAPRLPKSGSDYVLNIMKVDLMDSANGTKDLIEACGKFPADMKPFLLNDDNATWNEPVFAISL